MSDITLLYASLHKGLVTYAFGPLSLRQNPPSQMSGYALKYRNYKPRRHD